MINSKIKDSGGILVNVIGVYNIDGTYFMDCFSCETEDAFQMVCHISEEDSIIAKKNVDKQLAIKVKVYPISVPEIYLNEEDFEKKNNNNNLSFDSNESFLTNLRTMNINDKEMTSPEAIITGVVKSISETNTIQSEDEYLNNYEIQIELLGITITTIFKKDMIDIYVGNIIKCEYYLSCELLKEDFSNL